MQLPEATSQVKPEYRKSIELINNKEKNNEQERDYFESY